MLKRYHKELGFLPCHVAEAKGLIASLKCRKLSFSSHSLQELSKEIEAVQIGQIILKYDLNFDDCFEIALVDNRIEKLGFRVKSDSFDAIFIISREKRIITTWVNLSSDKHISLNPANYCNV